MKTIEDFVLYSNKHFESHLLGNGQGGTSFFLSSPVGMNHSAMGFSLVFQERVPETLGNRCCFCMFLFLFPVSLRINPPPYFLPFFDVTQKKSPAKTNIFPKSFQGQERMEIDDAQPVHEAARIVEQHSARCVSM